MNSRLEAAYAAAVAKRSAVRSPAMASRPTPASSSMAPTAATPKRHSRRERRKRSKSRAGRSSVRTARPAAARAASAGTAPAPPPQPERSPMALIAGARIRRSPISDTPNDEGGIAAAESQRRGQAHPRPQGARGALDAVKVAGRVALLEPERGRHLAAAAREEADNGFEG